MTASPVVLKVAIVGRLTVFFLVVFEGLSSSNCQLIVIGNLGINAFVLLLLWSVIGIENSHHALNQSDCKQKAIVTCMYLSMLLIVCLFLL